MERQEEVKAAMDGFDRLYREMREIVQVQELLDKCVARVKDSVTKISQEAAQLRARPIIPEQARAEIDGVLSRLSSLNATADDIGVMSTNLKADCAMIEDCVANAEETTPLASCVGCTKPVTERETATCESCGDWAHPECLTSVHGDPTCIACMDYD